jgi:hypothetical protein
MWRPLFGGIVQSPIPCCRWLKGLIVLALATSVSNPGGAVAQCTDTFNTFFIPAGSPPAPPAVVTGTPYQNIFPLGAGSSINALVSTMTTVNTAFLAGSPAFVGNRGQSQPDEIGGGVWARAVVGGVESKSATAGTIDTSQARGGLVGAPTPLAPVTGVGTCKGTVQENYTGYQFGFDLAKLNLGGSGAHVHFGLTGGYFSATTKDTTPELSWFKDPFHVLVSPAGSFRTETHVPYLALYSVFMNGNFVADAFVRQDFYLMALTDPENGLSNQSHTAQGQTVGGSAGYRFVLPASWYIEPSAGGSWSTVKVGRIDTPGVPNNVFPAGILNVGSVQVDDIESLLGRVSIRTGFTTKIGSTVVSPFVVGTVFHEFAGDVTSASRGGGSATTPCIPPLCPVQGINTFRDQLLNTSTSRVGTFGQVGLGAAAAFADPRWSAFARGDYRVGDNVEGYSINGGVRFQW